MRVLFDQGTPVPLRRFLNSHTVTTVYEKGWSRTRNGDLLRLADQERFEVFITTDQNLKYQQNPTDRKIAIVVLPTTSWPMIEKHTAKIAAVLDSIAPAISSKLISDDRYREGIDSTIRDRINGATPGFSVETSAFNYWNLWNDWNFWNV